MMFTSRYTGDCSGHRTTPIFIGQACERRYQRSEDILARFYLGSHLSRTTIIAHHIFAKPSSSRDNYSNDTQRPTTIRVAQQLGGGPSGEQGCDRHNHGAASGEGSLPDCEAGVEQQHSPRQPQRSHPTHVVGDSGAPTNRHH
ncbi:unnamed protein product [Timema podura]|uniref:Uncharacterized protein n=1 Tax=Timema podura TaxID=61482 RepID=A0ABN7PJ50_TIMPD|nr:unnamed protein product [Timema podura]